VLAVSKNNYGLVGASNQIGAKIFNLNSAGTQFGLAYLGESAYAARFYGNVLINSQGTMPGNLSVAGTLSKTTGSFKIDHPLDPANKYLYHSFVESPDMMNIYNGIIELDALGEAIVQLPTYFEALNSDFRYQLTSIGQPQSTLYIADEVQDLKFRIAGGKPHARVSWQVTGIRIDAYASAHRIVPEVVKEPEFKGYYLHPAEFGKPLSMSISERDAQMQDGKEAKQALKAQEARAKQ